MPYGVGAYKYNEPLFKQTNLYPTANYRRFPPGLGCAACAGLGLDVASSPGFRGPMIGLAAGLVLKKLTGSWLLGLAGGYIGYRLGAGTVAAPGAATGPVDASGNPIAAADVGCTSGWTIDPEGYWTCS